MPKKVKPYGKGKKKKSVKEAQRCGWENQKKKGGGSEEKIFQAFAKKRPERSTP